MLDIKRIFVFFIILKVNLIKLTWLRQPFIILALHLKEFLFL